MVREFVCERGRWKMRGGGGMGDVNS